MQKKALFLFILSGVVLLAVIIAGLTSLLSNNSAVPVKGPASTNVSLLRGEYRQVGNLSDADPTNQDALPNSVKVASDGIKVLLRTSVVEGYQIYECQVSTTDPSGFAWKVQAPFALLKADNGANVVHSTDPTWLYTKDGSEVKARVGQYSNPDGTAVAASATPTANAIAWLRLDVTEHRGANGLFSNVDQIQRLHTGGGKAPGDGCNQDVANQHVIRSVAYTAEYVFWGRQP